MVSSTSPCQARTNLDPSLKNKKPEVKSIRVVHGDEDWGVRKIHGRSCLGGLSRFPNPCVSPGVEASSPLPHLLQEALQPSLPTSLPLQKTRNLTPSFLPLANAEFPPTMASKWALTLLTDSPTKIRLSQSWLFHPLAEWYPREIVTVTLNKTCLNTSQEISVLQQF